MGGKKEQRHSKHPFRRGSPSDPPLIGNMAFDRVGVVDPLVLMLMLVSSAHASDDTERGLVVQVAVVSVLPPAVVLERCGERKIEGCTLFTIIHLDWTCSQDALGWAVSGRGFTRALVYLTHPAVLGHENTHIYDIRDGANDYLRELAALRFDSLARCSSAGVTAAAGFEAHVRRLAAASMKKRHQ